MTWKFCALWGLALMSIVASFSWYLTMVPAARATAPAADKCLVDACETTCCGKDQDRCCCLHREHCECQKDPTVNIQVVQEYDANGKVVPRRRTTEVPSCTSCHGR